MESTANQKLSPERGAGGSQGHARRVRGEAKGRELPILFSAPMVRAILAGRKTQTRRIMKPLRTANLPSSPGNWKLEYDANGFGGLVERGEGWTSCVPLPRSRYGVPGDRLWMRETWAVEVGLETVRAAHLDDTETVFYRADDSHRGPLTDRAGRGRPGIHMPRWASRITLPVVDIRGQRLNDISEEDARAEGFSPDPIPCLVNGKLATVAFFDPIRWFAALWDGINVPHAPWSSNPWVYAISFPAVSL